MSRLVSISVPKLAAIMVVGLLSACSNAKAPAGPATFQLPSAFNVQAASQTCLLHQTDAPTKEFMGGTGATPALQLPFMAYMTANGTKAFCDGKPATDIDKKWAALYVTLTNQPDKVKGITGG